MKTQEAIDKLYEARDEAGNIDIDEWPAHSQKCQCLIDQALALLQAQPCATCEGSGEVDDTIRSVRAGIDINKPCPICQNLKKPPEPTVEKLAKVLTPDCQPAPAGDFVKESDRTDLQIQLGPCVVCGETNYPLSMGGPTICPACDIGRDLKSRCEEYRARIEQQGKRIEELEAEIAKHVVNNLVSIDRIHGLQDKVRELIADKNYRATGKKIKQLQADLAAKEEEIERFKEALQWCGGSADFALDGKARLGWEKICQPLLKAQALQEEGGSPD